MYVQRLHDDGDMYSVMCENQLENMCFGVEWLMRNVLWVVLGIRFDGRVKECVGKSRRLEMGGANVELRYGQGGVWIGTGLAVGEGFGEDGEETM